MEILAFILYAVLAYMGYQASNEAQEMEMDLWAKILFFLSAYMGGCALSVVLGLFE